MVIEMVGFKQYVFSIQKYRLVVYLFVQILLISWINFRRIFELFYEVGLILEEYFYDFFFIILFKRYEIEFFKFFNMSIIDC